MPSPRKGAKADKGISSEQKRLQQEIRIRQHMNKAAREGASSRRDAREEPYPDSIVPSESRASMPATRISSTSTMPKGVEASVNEWEGCVTGVMKTMQDVGVYTGRLLLSLEPSNREMEEAVQLLQEHSEVAATALDSVVLSAYQQRSRLAREAAGPAAEEAVAGIYLPAVLEVLQFQAAPRAPAQAVNGAARSQKDDAELQEYAAMLQGTGLDMADLQELMDAGGGEGGAGVTTADLDEAVDSAVRSTRQIDAEAGEEASGKLELARQLRVAEEEARRQRQRAEDALQELDHRESLLLDCQQALEAMKEAHFEAKQGCSDAQARVVELEAELSRSRSRAAALEREVAAAASATAAAAAVSRAAGMGAHHDQKGSEEFFELDMSRLSQQSYLPESDAGPPGGARGSMGSMASSAGGVAVVEVADVIDDEACNPFLDQPAAAAAAADHNPFGPPEQAGGNPFGDVGGAAPPSAEPAADASNPLGGQEAAEAAEAGGSEEAAAVRSSRGDDSHNPFEDEGAPAAAAAGETHNPFSEPQADLSNPFAAASASPSAEDDVIAPLAQAQQGSEAGAPGSGAAAGMMSAASSMYSASSAAFNPFESPEPAAEASDAPPPAPATNPFGDPGSSPAGASPDAGGGPLRKSWVRRN